VLRIVTVVRRTGAIIAAQQLRAAGSSTPSTSRRHLGRETRACAAVNAQQLGAAGW